MGPQYVILRKKKSFWIWVTKGTWGLGDEFFKMHYEYVGATFNSIQFM